MEKIVLFDGVCSLCNQSVQFIIDKDPKAIFSFASLQSERGQALLAQYHLPSQLDSMVVITNNYAYTEASAVYQIAISLPLPYRLLAYSSNVVPLFLKNKLYQVIAANRYRWFGKIKSCRVATPEERQRFLS